MTSRRPARCPQRGARPPSQRVRFPGDVDREADGRRAPIPAYRPATWARPAWPPVARHGADRGARRGGRALPAVALADVLPGHFVRLAGVAMPANRRDPRLTGDPSPPSARVHFRRSRCPAYCPGTSCAWRALQCPITDGIPGSPGIHPRLSSCALPAVAPAGVLPGHFVVLPGHFVRVAGESTIAQSVVVHGPPAAPAVLRMDLTAEHTPTGQPQRASPTGPARPGQPERAIPGWLGRRTVDTLHPPDPRSKSGSALGAQERSRG